MIFIYNKHTNAVLMEIDGEIVTHDKINASNGSEISGFASEVEFAVGDSFEIAVKNRRRYAEILGRLQELDIQVPPIFEEIVVQGNFVISEAQQKIINEKNALRNELARL